ncbi:MAG: band 7 protein [Planctomycetaceae bacterium]|nr:band 7 protein [Planctomycetaceae bacterium]
MSTKIFQNRSFSGPLVSVLLLAGVGFGGYQSVEWVFNRIYVPVGSSLLLNYKGAFLFGSRNYPADGQLANLQKGEIGVAEQMPGPGRHFYCPIWWERTIVEDKVVKPGEVAVVTCLVGKDLRERHPEQAAGDNAPQGSSADNNFLVDGDIGHTEYKGVLRKVYGPGRYRVNPYAYDFKIIKTDLEQSGTLRKYSGWVEIKTGYVGVVTNQTDNPITGARKGIQPNVLPPGLYPMNPREQKVDIVEIGYREKTITSPVLQDAKGEAILDSSGEPTMAAGSGGIVFPSRDGFTIHMDFTAIWGIMPEQAPHVVEFSGNIEAVENRVVVPLIESICRNEGSKLGAVELLVGETREHFQDETTRQFKKTLEATGVALQYGLVRHIYIPQEVRLPIQQKYLADELKLTRDQEQLTARTEANLREAEQKVELEEARIAVETEKLVAEKKAEGEKTAAETRAETGKLMAAIDRQTAELERQATVALGEAEAGAQKLMEEAKAGRFKLAVGAFGSGAAFNQWVFASGLPEDIQLNLLYAGEGTFWTDLKGFTDVMLGREMQESRKATAKSGMQSAKPAKRTTE